MSNLTKNKKVAGGIVAASIVLLVGVLFGSNIVKANQSMPSSFWADVVEKYSNLLAEKTEVPTLPEDGMPNMPAGIAGDTFSSARIAETHITTGTAAGVSASRQNSASGTLAAMLNPARADGGRIRRVTRAEFLTASSSDTFIGPVFIDMGTSTGQFATSSQPMFSQRLTTSTNPTSLSASTTLYNQPWRGIWNPGEYWQCAASHASISTTAAYCLVEYVYLD